MAHTPEAVDQFDQELYDKLYPAAQKEIQNLKEVKKTYLHSETFNAWDLLYVENQINIREHQVFSLFFDEEWTSWTVKRIVSTSL